MLVKHVSLVKNTSSISSLVENKNVPYLMILKNLSLTSSKKTTWVTYCSEYCFIKMRNDKKYMKHDCNVITKTLYPNKHECTLFLLWMLSMSIKVFWWCSNKKKKLPYHWLIWYMKESMSVDECKWDWIWRSLPHSSSRLRKRTSWIVLGE